ncbi:adenylosuccinate synthetase [Aequorivita sp. CIP111184]|uniref:adenylosuccinate synthetase n=1 Tax=Aequorivita sp. CIP111184 TaxID=2211356 RepID=UPI0011BDBC78|nr:adenylosuccinate synthetase [Aequorivita sp. CIP111184]
MKNILFVLFTLLITTCYAQKPTEVPKPSEKPIDLGNPADVIIYIVLPLCAVLFFFIWRGKRNKTNK